ncbi:MAG TPA: TlpA disulfide reductase family protein [Myxococcaceae bacterium]|nr:TlpA disulfide reductase family protein [Myxococcaceae bacterium]
MRAPHWLLLVGLTGCFGTGSSMGTMMGMGGTSGGMYGSTTMGGMPSGGGAPPAASVPTDPLAFQEWPTGLWWGQSDDRGHPVVLTAWGTSCRPCVQSLPQLEEIGKRFASRGVHIYAINIEPDATRFPALLQSLSSYPAILVDPGGYRLAAVLGLHSIPTTWILDGSGKIAWVQEGWDGATASAVTTHLTSILGGG